MDEECLRGDLPILQIRNHHVASCGTPPRVEERPHQYLGYFENRYGEQMIFVFDQDSGIGRLYAGDANWEKPYEVVDGVAINLVMSPEELLWLQACWEAATFGIHHRSCAAHPL